MCSCEGAVCANVNHGQSLVNDTSNTTRVNAKSTRSNTHTHEMVSGKSVAVCRLHTTRKRSETKREIVSAAAMVWITQEMNMVEFEKEIHTLNAQRNELEN